MRTLRSIPTLTEKVAAWSLSAYSTSTRRKEPLSASSPLRRVVSDLDPKAHSAQYSTSVKLELPGLYVVIGRSRSVVVATGASQVKSSQAW
jgi:hypothetical protein